MATYRLTANDDIRAGTNGDDTFDGYGVDDGLGLTGGTDWLSGRGGNDLFLLNVTGTPFGGQIDGGDDTDTVMSYGFDLGTATFQNVEILSIESYETSAQIGQLNAFSTITSSVGAMTRIKFYLTGAGGTIDVSGKMAPGKAIELDAIGLGSALDATGTELDDAFTTSRFSDIVRGGGGADTFTAVKANGSPGGTDQLFGGTGADTFVLRRQAGTFDGGAGYDTVRAYQSSSFGLTDGDLSGATFANVERLMVGPNRTFASVEQINAFSRITGGDSDRTIKFVLSGNTAGGAIDFASKIANPAEKVSLSAFSASSAVDLTGTTNDDSFAGSRFNDTLRGGDGDDFLGGADFVGGAMGRDELQGGAGDDLYHVNASDTVVETLTGAAGGDDTVLSFGGFDLAGPRVVGEVENLILRGYLGNEAAAMNGYGNALDNRIEGNDGNNILDGRGGADHLVGNGGNDTFYVRDAGDSVEERSDENEGVDRVFAFVDVDLENAAQASGLIENVFLQGTASIDARGNALDNKLVGNAGNNVLDGRGGRDVMQGGAGNDIYYVDTVGDRVVEADGGGLDRVFSSVSFSLAGQFAETLRLTGNAAINGTGNQLDNTIIGNGQANVINGGAGADTLTGGGGADWFVFNAPLLAANADTITDFAVGQDRIRLDDTVFTELSGPGKLSAGAFAASADGVATGADQRILYAAETGNLYYDADGSGAGERVLFATLSPALEALTNDSFYVV